MFLAILLACLLTLSAVSAVEDAASDAAGIDDATDDVVNLEDDNEDLSVENENDEVISDEIVFDEDDGTFTALQDRIDTAAENSTVNLVNDYFYNEAEGDNGPVTISKSLTINGNGVTIDADAKTSIFSITANNVVIKNITFLSGQAKYGGAIGNSGSNVEIISCEFIGCTGVSDDFGYYGSQNYGGAIYNDPLGSNLNIDSCNFSECSSYNGGAICNYGATDLNVNSCNFEDCAADNQGGAIFNDGSSCTVNSCNFTSCSAMFQGEAIFTAAQNCNVNSSLFMECFENSAYAIYNNEHVGTAKAKNCQFPDLTSSQALYETTDDGCTFKKPSLYLPLFVDSITYGEDLIVSTSTSISEGSVYFGLDDDDSWLIMVDLEEDDFGYGYANFTYVGVTAGTHEVMVRFDGNDQYAATIVRKNITVSKAQPVITINSTELYLGNDYILEFSISEDATGILNVTIDDLDPFISEIQEGLCYVDLGDGLPVGNYELTATYEGDENFLPANLTTIISVKDKPSLPLEVTVSNITYGEDVTVFVSSGDTTIEDVGIMLNGLEGVFRIISLANGLGNMTYSDVPAGTYEVMVAFMGNEQYSETIVRKNVTVNKRASQIVLNSTAVFDYGEKIFVEFLIDEDAEGYLNFTMEGGFEAINDIDMGTCVLMLDEGTYAGIYTVTAAYDGDDNYLPTSLTVNVTVNRIDPEVEVSDAVFYYGASGDATVTIWAGDIIALDKISVVDHPEAVIEVNDCDVNEYIVTISNLTVGSYTLSVTTNASDNYNSIEATGSIDVNRAIVTVENIDEFFTSDGYLISELLELVFEGEFDDLRLIITKPVTLIGEGAVFKNSRFFVLSDNVTIRDIEINHDGEGEVISVYGVSNIILENNRIFLNGTSDDNSAVFISNSTGVSVIKNYIEASGINYVHGILVYKANDFVIDDNTLIVDSDENATGIIIYGPSSGEVKNNRLQIKAKKVVYSINTDSSSGPIKATYINNTIDSEAFFAVGIYDDSEEIRDNKITLKGNYTIGIVVLSNGTNVSNNEITLNASNEGNDSDVKDDNVDVETTGILVKNDSTISGNTIDSSDKSISVVEGKSEISGNNLNGQVIVGSDENIISNNVVKSNKGHAVVFSQTASNNKVDGNELYSNEGNGNSAVYNQNGANQVTNNKINPGLNISIASFEEGSTPGSIVITANGNFTGNVTVTITGPVSASYVVTVRNGEGSVTIKESLTAGTYTANATSIPDDNFTDGQAFCTFNVTAKAVPAPGNNQNTNTAPAQTSTASAPAKETIKLTLKTVKVKKSAKKLVLQATLKINGKKVKGKTVTFKFNGKTYKAKTNKKGVAKVTIKKAVLKKLKVGKKVKYQASYGGTTVKKTAKIKK
jgi:parallel beta-helix repeat protein